ncbi:MAG: phosphate/phosphite/phosphonate ABC transporter substrate-binding protein [Candidatus Diapherotrites archaeon]|nr:phosphate/phosphite/phosphonate ABC transporter substrate-binding protein [Candidatus Diapherotrites archaeon]
MKAFPTIFFFLIAAFLVFGCIQNLSGQTSEAKEFRIGFIPSEKASEVSPKAEKIAEFLSQKMGVPVKAVVPTSYEPLIEGLRFEQLDAIYADGGPGWIAYKKAGAEVVLAEKRADGRTYYNAVVFVRSDSDIDSLEEVSGKKIAFTSWTGSSGFVMPVGEMVKRGIITPLGDDFAGLEKGIAQAFEAYSVSGGYKQSLELLADGKVDVAGGADDSPQQFLSEEQQGKIRVLEDLGRVPSHPVLVGKHVSQEMREKFVNAMLELNNPENVQLLKDIYGVDGLVKTTTQEHLGDLGKKIDALTGAQDAILDKDKEPESRGTIIYTAT